MAMITGRVLLVCALCVLWCGAAFGHAMDDYCSEGGGNGLRHTSNGGDDGVSLKADCGLLATRMALIKAVEAAEAGQGLSGDTKPQGNLKEPLPNNTEGSPAPGAGGSDVAVQPPPAVTLEHEGSDTGGQQVTLPNVVDTNGGKKGDDKNGSELEPEEIGAGQSSSSSGGAGTLGGKGLPSKQTSKSNEPSNRTPTQEEDAGNHRITPHSPEEKAEEEHEVKKENVSHEAPTETHGSPANDAGIQTATPSPPPATMNEPSSTEDLPPVQALQRVQDDHAESRPPSPTANGDAANNEADNSTEDGIPNNDPAADGAGTAEEKQNENKEANPKETPVEATAMKNTTATTGDSDGSTAVFHTTSPLLLLLLVVASAAAAAVVAA
ncbi:Mucin-associated surface protein (MASP), subgroup S099 [Trypanosoma cruzi]|uniref:Mucin-associated surface protein (MASP) subgroup S099 n=1 Tax=Trypanosoma cruzi TaxID=5693 RepID=A0A7J6XRB8_TRYCR|nr:Mucin-associated surface protein (MASP) subgroup S099 [Trypanosoma cruzi]KAF8289745.1 Mucin-associated surface protein (MASP), subgroup S099 [Trypanosoma cruzi]KAF8289748.1 Mucin-associated surface protein (MASP), subgroup S099 [Trypanosoma cruzi]